jgi:kynureninase
MEFKNSKEFAALLDKKDELAHFQDKYHFPRRNNRKSIYFCGNSLGLQPKQTKQFIDDELTNWAENGVEGHFIEPQPWVEHSDLTKESLSKLVGSELHEVVSMNNLTTNLHLMLASFYYPKGKRSKILIEKGAFPSDHYAVESHIKRLGLDPKEHMVTLGPSEGYNFSTKEIVDKIAELGEELALVMFPGVQYYSGQFFDMKALSQAAHKVGAYAGFDLAHAMGNLPMNLHDDDVDFATWCSYKYLNSGPGGTSGVFVHEKHSSNPAFPKLTGWWGHALSNRFEMDNNFTPAFGVDAWMLSNLNILPMAAHRASLDLFDQAGILKLREKSILLTGYLEHLLTTDEILKNKTTIISPSNPNDRGCQLSVEVEGGKEIFNSLIKAGVILDWREPGVIRLAPTPMYNSFSDVWEFISILKEVYAK